MSKKTNKSRNRLAIVFLVLFVAVILVQIDKDRKGERSFKAEVVEFETDAVTSMDLHTPLTGDLPITLKKGSDSWNILYEGKTYEADNDLVKSMVNDLAGLKAVQKVGASKEKWAEFDVTDSAGVRVVVKENKKILGDVYIGRFTYNQNTRKPKTYVRKNKDKDVFAVEGYLSMTFNRDVNGLRNKTIFTGNRNDITKIAVNYPSDSSFVLSKEASGWMLNGSLADSTRVSSYLGTVSYLVGTEFRDDVEKTVLQQAAPFSMVIEGINMNKVEIKVFVDELGQAALLSSENPNAIFDASVGEVFKKVFIGPDQLLPPISE